MTLSHRLRTATPPRVRGALKRAGQPLYEVAYTLWRGTLGARSHLHQPIFMLGCPRSGTSIAVQLFGRHPDVANLSEAGPIWDPYGYSDPEADHEWTSDDVRAIDVRRLHRRFEFHRQLHRADRFVNKHPRSSVRLGYIDAIFPDAQYIHVVRDGRAVAHSILDMIEREPYRQQIPMGDFCKPPGWRDLLRDDPVEQAALQWRAIVEYVLDWQPRLKERFLTFTYEELCADCRGTLARAFQFAGLPADFESLDWIPETLDSRNLKWQRSFTAEQIDMLEQVQGPLLTRLGYRLHSRPAHQEQRV